MSDFAPYQSYPAEAAAEPLLAMLREREIPFETSLDTGQASFDPSFANNASFTRFVVKLHPGDVEWVRQLEQEAHGNALQQLSPDHYLFRFSDEELIDILTKPDEWSNLDVSLAGQLLKQRGRDVSPDTIRLLRQNRLREQTKADDNNQTQILLGYGTALLGGFIGIFIGAHLYWHRKTLSNGHRVYAFPATDRVHGLRILVLGIFMFVLLFAVKVLRAD
ncbi:hypothetical protein GCM10023185_44250 [Hymenobacter saemangeumensis]|uniref:DUF2007 domain-containing protein n=1 Tax=Hymenobacter saemangeumensis TaxID=1084522 RepID=A0ABP8IS71_9BACT